ncbi:flagellar basal body-associated FliL family protein [Sphingomonas qilianensis]|uniref:Flagellar protein FliL n=1 Tax=Sphingomonas qilianensis TaxID=1736690 RepID=A0ABU9XQP3_9SPHN
MDDVIEAKTEDEDEDQATPTAEPARAVPKRRRLWLIIAAIVLLAAAVGGYLLVVRAGYSSLFTPASPSAPPAETEAETYVDVPPITVNLRVPGGQARFLKLRFMIVAGQAEQADAIRARLPILLDALQPFLRELRPEDLNGSAAVFRIKEEMMVRARAIYGDGVVRDLLIQDLVQQ